MAEVEGSGELEMRKPMRSQIIWSLNSIIRILFQMHWKQLEGFRRECDVSQFALSFDCCEGNRFFREINAEIGQLSKKVLLQ